MSALRGIQSQGIPLPGLTGTDNITTTRSTGRRQEVNGLRTPTHPRDARTEGARKLAVDNGHLRRASSVGVGILTALRAIVAVGTLGISEGIKAAVDKAIEYHGTKKGPKEPLTIRLPGTDQTMQMSPSALPGRIASSMTHTELQAAIQAKVDAGHTLVQQLTNGTHNGARCTVEDMSNIMFFLQAKAESTHGSFREGAFTLSDPGQRIRSFLDSCPEAYQRESSHIGGFQSQDGGRHRGIDAYGSGTNLRELLPNGMKTLLYGSMRQNPDLHMPEDRLYLKIESHGAWLTRPKGGGDLGGPRRFGNHHDVGAILGHSLSFIATRGQGSAQGTFKERIPNDVKNSFNALVESAPENIKTVLSAKNPTSTAAGIRVMLANVQNALDQIGDTDPPLRLELERFQTETRAKYDHADLRIGNEVIFTATDFT